MKAGDKRAQEESGELLGLKDKNIPNPYVQELLEEMESWESGTVERDGYLLFLFVPFHPLLFVFTILISRVPTQKSSPNPRSSTPYPFAIRWDGQRAPRRKRRRFTITSSRLFSCFRKSGSI